MINRINITPKLKRKLSIAAIPTFVMAAVLAFNARANKVLEIEEDFEKQTEFVQNAYNEAVGDDTYTNTTLDIYTNKNLNSLQDIINVYKDNKINENKKAPQNLLTLIEELETITTQENIDIAEFNTIIDNLINVVENQVFEDIENYVRTTKNISKSSYSSNIIENLKALKQAINNVEDKETINYLWVLIFGSAALLATRASMCNKINPNRNTEPDNGTNNNSGPNTGPTNGTKNNIGPNTGPTNGPDENEYENWTKAREEENDPNRQKNNKSIQKLYERISQFYNIEVFFNGRTDGEKTAAVNILNGLLTKAESTLKDNCEKDYQKVFVSWQVETLKDLITQAENIINSTP